jgi:hypothetical protein
MFSERIFGDHIKLAALRPFPPFCGGRKGWGGRGLTAAENI